MSFDLDRPAISSLARVTTTIEAGVAKMPSEVTLQGAPIDERFEILLHEPLQAKSPVAGLVVPSAAIAFTRFLAMIIRCTSEGPS